MKRIPVLGEKVLVLSPQIEFYNEALCPRSSTSAGSGECPRWSLHPGKGSQKYSESVLPASNSGLYHCEFPRERSLLPLRFCAYQLFLWDGLWIVGHQEFISMPLPVRQNGLDSCGLLQE